MGPDLAFVARRLRLLILDVDGVLTDNRNIQGLGVDAKAFHVHDKTGIRLSQDRLGLRVALATGRESSATRLFAQELDIPDEDCVVSPDGKKLQDVTRMLARKGLEWHEVAFIGDDIADIPLLRRVGLPIAVADALPYVKPHAKYVTRLPGGFGAVREAIDWIAGLMGAFQSVYDYELTLRESALPAIGQVVKGDRLEIMPGHGVDEGVHQPPLPVNLMSATDVGAPPSNPFTREPQP